MVFELNAEPSPGGQAVGAGRGHPDLGRRPCPGGDAVGSTGLKETDGRRQGLCGPLAVLKRMCMVTAADKTSVGPVLRELGLQPR